MEEPIYFDYAATTPVRPEVVDAMLPYLGAAFGNPSSPHRFGRSARAGLEQARREVAEAVGAESNQVIFTSGGTEADNLAVIGTALAARNKGRRMAAVTASTEHKAVLAAAHAVVHLGGEEVMLPVDSNGLVDLEALARALGGNPAVVSIMWVNNETGVVQPTRTIAQMCNEAAVPFHSDAVQAFGKVPVSLSEARCTLISLSGHKIGAPKGIGALVVRAKGIVEALIHGGGQQFGIRPGTENVAGAVAMGCAARLASQEQASEAARLRRLRDELAAGLRAGVPDIVIHSEQVDRAPHILSTSVPGTDGQALLMHLDLAGIAVSGGSACTTGSVDPSHVLAALGVPRDLAQGTVRFSLGHDTTPPHIERVIAIFPTIVQKVRDLAVVLGRA
jgi:cysteine desulfurase